MSLYKLRDWIQEDKLNINFLCQNECLGAIQLIEEKFLDKMVNDPICKESWNYLSKNSTYEAVLLLEKNFDEINFYELSKNTCPKAIEIIKKNIENGKNIGWSMINANNSIEAINLLKENPDKLWISCLCRNNSSLVPSLLEMIPDANEKLDYFFLAFNKADWALDLLEKEYKKEESNLKLEHLCSNESMRAINIVKKTMTNNMNYWVPLSSNSMAIDLLEQNKEHIDFEQLLRNSSPRAIKLIEELIEKNNALKTDYDMSILSENFHAIDFLEKNRDLIDWTRISKNPAIFEINKKYLKERIDIFLEELCINVFHPRNEGRLWFIDE
jgi:hypothetical protein